MGSPATFMPLHPLVIVIVIVISSLPLLLPKREGRQIDYDYEHDYDHEEGRGRDPLAGDAGERDLTRRGIEPIVDFSPLIG